MNNLTNVINQPEYGISFWNCMAGKTHDKEVFNRAESDIAGSYTLPAESEALYAKKLLEESVFRNIATVVSAGKSDNQIYAYDTTNMASWPGDGSYESADVDDEFTLQSIEAHKCGILLKFARDFACDARFDLKNHLLKTLAKRVGPIEDKGFITGDGEDTPTGILAADGGAATGVTASTLTYDNVISLYFSLSPEYRKHGCWLMNDNTAMALRKLKDENGRYLWRDNDDTIFGKPVYISPYMPDVASGKKPIAFGDFSYYWIIQRNNMSIRPMEEKYALTQKVGYLCTERLDGKLTRTNAVKVFAVTA